MAVVCADALSFQADVLALKHAQGLFGVDAAVADVLFGGAEAGTIRKALPKLGHHKIVASAKKLGVEKVLYVGVKPLFEFDYQGIREFARLVLEILSQEVPHARHVALTLHGAGYGLDVTEAFESEVAGLLDAVNSKEFPNSLERISIVERDPERADRLAEILRAILPTGLIGGGKGGAMREVEEGSRERLRSVGYASASKPYIFVAMPFADEFNDTFHYGISGAVNAAGFLCERADLSAFTGDVMDWVTKRIAGAVLVVADLSTANPNVYLEVGYAWGLGKPTVLLVRDTVDLKFDVKSQRCLVYNKSIKSLETLLRKELEELKPRIATP